MAPVTNFTIEVKVNFILSFSHFFILLCVCQKGLKSRKITIFNLHFLGSQTEDYITKLPKKKKRTIPNTEKQLPNNKDTMTFNQKQQNEKSTQYNRIGLDNKKIEVRVFITIIIIKIETFLLVYLCKLVKWLELDYLLIIKAR